MSLHTSNYNAVILIGPFNISADNLPRRSAWQIVSRIVSVTQINALREAHSYNYVLTLLMMVESSMDLPAYKGSDPFLFQIIFLRFTSREVNI